MFEWIERLLLPYYCVVCRSASDNNRDLCRSCQANLPYLQSSCYRCAIPLPTSIKLNAICGHCLQKPPLFDRTFALCYYQGTIVKFISALKFHQQLIYARLLGELMALAIKNSTIERPDVLIPVPLHRKRLCQRGFNQALEIAKIIAKSLRIDVNATHCQRHRYTHPQLPLPAKHRYANVKNAFTSYDNLPSHVAIIDDVMTTGHTANELSKALRRVGVKKIQVWCCARVNLNT